MDVHIGRENVAEDRSMYEIMQPVLGLSTCVAVAHPGGSRDAFRLAIDFLPERLEFNDRAANDWR